MKLPKKIAALLTVSLINGYLITNNIYADSEMKVNIIQGKERYETAIQISDKGWKTGASEAIIVNDKSIVDAISATPFASLKNAPILLTQKESLNEKTKTQLKKLGVKKVYIIGGENVISSEVENQLKSENLEIDRIKGQSRENTAIEIAKRIHDIKPISEIAVVNGYKGLSDAVSIASISGSKNMPILLASSANSAKEVYDFIKDKNIKTSYVVGGDAVISNDIKSNLPNVKSFEGKTRNETNSMVIDNFYPENNINNIYVSKDGIKNEDQLIDALAVGVLAAKENSPVMIVSNKLDGSQKSIIDTKSFDTITQVGGNGNENSFNEIKEIQDTEVFNVSTISELNEAIEKANANDIINMGIEKRLFKLERSITEDINISTNKKININISGNYNGKIVVNTPNAKIVNKGSIKNIIIESNSNVNSVEILNQGTIDSLKISDNAKSKVENTNGATISNLEVAKNASKVEINNKGKVENLKNNSSNTNISNSGTITNGGTTGGGSTGGTTGGGSTDGTTGGGSTGGTTEEGSTGGTTGGGSTGGTTGGGSTGGTTEEGSTDEGTNDNEQKPIEKITPVVTNVKVTNEKITYGDKLSDIRLTGTVKDGEKDVVGTFTFENPDTVLNAGTVDVNWVFVPQNTKVYRNLYGEISLYVDKVQPKIEGTLEEITNVAPGVIITELEGLEVKGIDGNVLSGTWNGIAPENKGTKSDVEFTFTPDDTLNYTSKTITASVTTLPVVIEGAPTISTNTIKYGQKLGVINLTGNTMKYDDVVVSGTFEFENPELVPNAGKRNVVWKFIPQDNTYETVTGTSQITVQKIATKAVRSISQDTAVSRVKSNELKDLRIKDEYGNYVEGRWSGRYPEEGNTTQYTFIPNDLNYDSVTITVEGVKQTQLPSLTNKSEERINPTDGNNSNGVADSVYEILKDCNWAYDDEKRTATVRSGNVMLEDKDGKDGIDGIITLKASSEEDDKDAIRLLGLMLGSQSKITYEELIKRVANGTDTIDDGTRKIEIKWDGEWSHTIKITFYNYGTN